MQKNYNNTLHISLKDTELFLLLLININAFFHLQYISIYQLSKVVWTE